LSVSNFAYTKEKNPFLLIWRCTQQIAGTNNKIKLNSLILKYKFIQAKFETLNLGKNQFDIQPNYLVMLRFVSIFILKTAFCIFGIISISLSLNNKLILQRL